MRTRLIVPSFALSLLLLACAAFTMPVTASAQAISDNPEGAVLDAVGDGEVMQSNHGTVKTNAGTINYNAPGAVIENNVSVVRKNDGVIVNNFSYNTNPDKGNGKILNNYLVRPATFVEGFGELPELWGTVNNFYRIPRGSSISYALDWSQNPDQLTSSLYLYVGAPDNEESLRGATFKAAEGCQITLKSTQGDGFNVVDNGDGTFTISVDPGCRKTDIDLDSVVDVQRLVPVTVAVNPAEGGAVVHHDSGDEFVSGWFGNGAWLSLKAVPREGHRFVDWVVPSDDDRVQVRQDGTLEIRAVWDEFMYPEPVACSALFEQIADTGDGTASSDPDSAGGADALPSSPAPTIAQAGDSAFAVLALAGMAVIAASAIGLAALRKSL